MLSRTRGGGLQSQSNPEAWTVTAGKVRMRVNSREAWGCLCSRPTRVHHHTWSLHYVSPEDMKRPLFCLQEGHYLVGGQPLGGFSNSWTTREAGVKLTAARNNGSGGSSEALLCALKPSTAQPASAFGKVL